MRAIAEKLVRFEREVTQEKGRFNLVALVRHDRSQRSWDLVLSAPWFPRKQRDGLDYVIGRLRKELTKEEMLHISKVVLLEPSHPFVMAVTRTISTEGTVKESTSNVLDGNEVDHMFLITSRYPGNGTKNGRRLPSGKNGKRKPQRAHTP